MEKPQQRKKLTFLEIAAMGRFNYVNNYLDSQFSEVAEHLEKGVTQPYVLVSCEGLEGIELVDAEARNKEVKAKRKKYLEQVKGCFTAILQTLTPSCYSTVTSNPKFIEWRENDRKDPVELLNLIIELGKGEYGQQAEVDLRKLSELRQRPDEPTGSFLHRWQELYNRIVNLDGRFDPRRESARTMEAMAGGSLIRSLDQRKNATFLADHRRISSQRMELVIQGVDVEENVKPWYGSINQLYYLIESRANFERNEMTHHTEEEPHRIEAMAFHGRVDTPNRGTRRTFETKRGRFTTKFKGGDKKRMKTSEEETDKGNGKQRCVLCFVNGEPAIVAYSHCQEDCRRHGKGKQDKNQEAQRNRVRQERQAKKQPKLNAHVAMISEEDEDEMIAQLNDDE